MDDTRAKLRLAIVGAGIGGLSLAVTISRLDHNKDIEIHIFEAAHKLDEIGAGLTIFHRSWELLKLLGCQEFLNARAFTYSRMGSREINNDAVFQFRKSDQKDGFTFLNLTVPGGSWSLHRADLHQALLNGLNDRSYLHLSSRVVGYEDRSSAVSLIFQDGTTKDFDLLVGADGIKSVIRREFVTANIPHEMDRINPIFSGTRAYRGLIRRETLEQRLPNHRALRTPLVYCGKNKVESSYFPVASISLTRTLKHVATYPISMGSLINVIAFFSDSEEEGKPLLGKPVREATLEEVLKRFDGWEKEIVDLLECVEQPTCWSLLTTRPISSYGLGRIALLGDAAHAMTPHLASGAGQALEDAYVLASVMTTGVQDNLDVARITEIYSTVRQPMGNFVLNNARRQGLRFELNAVGQEDIQENEPVQIDRMLGIAEDIIRAWKWIWTTSVHDDQKRALALL